MPLFAGTRLGAYEILSPLGAGGMGEVYRAKDTRVDRVVALKVLPEEFFEDEERRARFRREARSLASLNHPGIAVLYSFEEVPGSSGSSTRHVLAMELVAGEGLDAKIAAGPLPLEEALSYARQIADALEAAHEAGLVHRDLKPANVKVRDDGVVKVLDFGLAKATAGAESGSDPPGGPVSGDAPTMTSPVMTQAGHLFGTAAYMSPEQARGHAVDKRTDIWAFGVVLYEMLTGRKLFAGETASDTIAAVLTREPDFASLPAAVPAHVRALLGRCLERDPKRRLRDIGEARHQLEEAVPPSASVAGAAATPASSAPSSPPVAPQRGRRLLWLAAAAVAVALIAVAFILWQRRQPSPAERAPATSRAPAQSIAVLPFINQSGSSDDEYFSDGMTDELASALMKVPGLRVAARSSAFTFKGKGADARDVGVKLHVASVLEGTVRRAGSKLRVTAQLVNTADGLAIWSERYEREAKDVFKVQDDITGAIVAALRLTLSASTAAAGRAENAEAHDLYLRGRFLMFKQTEDGLRKGLDYFAQALAKDPGYAPAYAGMAFAYSWLADAYLPPRDAEPKAKAAAMKALALDSTIAEAHTSLAFILWVYDWEVPAAEVEFRRALQLNPNSMEAHNYYAFALCATKRWDEGLAETQRAIALDPLSPFPSWTRETCLSMARRYDEVIEQHKKTEELDPNFFYWDSPVGVAYREKRMYAEAVAEYQHVRQITGGQPVAGLAITYARMGRTAEARNVLREFLELSARRYISSEQIALIHASLGEKDQAFARLDRAYEDRSGFLPTGILTWPDYDPLRADPRFTVFLRKMGLPK